MRIRCEEIQRRADYYNDGDTGRTLTTGWVWFDLMIVCDVGDEEWQRRSSEVVRCLVVAAAGIWIWMGSGMGTLFLLGAKRLRESVVSTVKCDGWNEFQLFERIAYGWGCNAKLK